MGDAQPPGSPDVTGPLPTSVLADRYRIERVIGEGAFGRVYLAFDTRLRRNIAMKELLASRSTTDHATYERYVERFQREARATGTIQHPNVVTVYDLHVDNTGNNYLVMEYVDGTDLRDLLTQVGTLPTARAIAITIDIARALEAVHEQEIVHRDIKPTNIMITRRGVAKLMDFGIAQVGHESLRTQIASGHPGTPAYMSPEQSSGYGYIDGRSDLYSLGLVLYEMLVGEPYTRKRQPIAAARPDVPPQIIAIINRLMAREIDARYQSATDLLADLTPLAATATSSTMPAVEKGQFPPAPPQPGWQTGGVQIVPPVGVPSAYGGPASQNPQGTPLYTPPLPPPGTTGSSGYPPPIYQGPYQYGTSPPPSGPPKKSNRGAIFAIGGAVIAVLLIAGVFLAVSRNKDGGTATATVRGTTVSGLTGTPGTLSTTTATVRSTTQPTPTTAVTSTPSVTTTATPRTATPTVGTTSTPRPSTTAAPLAAGTFMDPKNYVRFQYPSGWTQGKLVDNTNVLALDGPDDLLFWSYINDPQQGNVTDEIGFIKKNQDDSTDFTYTNQKIADLTIAGEPAKTITYSFASKTDSTNKGLGQWWVVNHAGRQFSFKLNNPGPHQAEVNAVLASIVWSNNGTFPQVTAWADPKNLVTIQYPSKWTTATDTNVKSNVLELDGPDNAFFFVDIYDPQIGTVASEIQDFRDTHAKDTKYTYTDAAVTDIKVGGDPAKTFSYTYAAKDKPGTTFNGQIWIVNHNGKEYVFTGSNIGTHKAEMDAIIASITLLQ